MAELTYTANTFAEFDFKKIATDTAGKRYRVTISGTITSVFTNSTTTTRSYVDAESLTNPTIIDGGNELTIKKQIAYIATTLNQNYNGGIQQFTSDDKIYTGALATAQIEVNKIVLTDINI